jgi:hypothetical protein
VALHAALWAMTTSSGAAIPPQTDFWNAKSPRSSLRQWGAGIGHVVRS